MTNLRADDSEDQEKAQFSNAILDGYLNYIEQKTNKTCVKKFYKTIKALGLSEKWLRDKKMWHSAALHEKILKAFQDAVPKAENLIYDCAISLYADTKIQRFTSIAGLLLRPAIVFGKLSSVASRMNTYNSYDYKTEKRRFGYSRGRLIQRYPDSQKIILNAYLCDASRGSLMGMMSFLGHQVLDIREDRCVKHGDSQCEYVVTWLHRAAFLETLIFLLIGGGVLVLTKTFDWSSSLRLSFSTISALALASLFSNSRYRRKFKNIFKYQQETLTSQRHSNNTIAVLNRKLLDYQKQVNQVMSAVGLAEHSVSIFHDMASPLFVLSSSISELSRELHSEGSDSLDYSRSVELCSTIERATDNLITLQRVFNTATNTDMQGEIASVQIIPIVDSCLDMFKLLCRHNKIQLIYNPLERPVAVQAVIGSVESICINLVQNAIKALRIHNGPRVLRVDLIEEDQYVILVVEDTGPGIPESKLETLWTQKNRFAHSALKHSKDGLALESGFGLPFLKKIIEKSKGSVDLKTGNTGTRFTIHLPKKI